MPALLHLPYYAVGVLFVAIGFGMVGYAIHSGRVYFRPNWITERERPLLYWTATLAYLLFGVVALSFTVARLVDDLA